MWQSMRAGKPVTMPNAKSIASGLAPPFAGDSSYRLCSKYVDDIILVSDSAIARAVTQLFKQGLVVEPSGAVGYAALAENRVPDVIGRKIVLVCSGGNISIDEMADLSKMLSNS
jgi:threonine dehydratase